VVAAELDATCLGRAQCGFSAFRYHLGLVLGEIRRNRWIWSHEHAQYELSESVFVPDIGRMTPIRATRRTGWPLRLFPPITPQVLAQKPDELRCADVIAGAR
jgi:hypothetical protein